MGGVFASRVNDAERVVVVSVDVSGVSRTIRKLPNITPLPSGGPSALDAAGPEAPSGETQGDGEQSLGSTESEMWLGELMMMTEEEGLFWPGGATKLNHWTTTSGVG